MDDAALSDLHIEFNPLWKGILENNGIVREQYLSKIIQYSETGEITVLNGVRRSGKTILLHQIIMHLINH